MILVRLWVIGHRQIPDIPQATASAAWEHILNHPKTMKAEIVQWQHHPAQTVWRERFWETTGLVLRETVQSLREGRIESEKEKVNSIGERKKEKIEKDLIVTLLI